MRILIAPGEDSSTAQVVRGNHFAGAHFRSDIAAKAML